MALLESIKGHLVNVPGFRTSRKIVAIESDDWGSIRVSSKNAYNHLLAKGYEVDCCPYNRYDSLESNEDLESLFDLLLRFRDERGNPPIITGNNIVANPDFEKILQSNFDTYFYEPFTTTLDRYPNREKVLSYYKAATSQNIFRAQFHGREHVNIKRWLRALRDDSSPIRDAFHHQMFTLHVKGPSSGRREFLDAFGGSTISETDTYVEILREGLDLFESFWGFRPLSFIAPCYTWAPDLEPLLNRFGIKYIQGTHVQRIPTEDDSLRVNRRYHYTGQQSPIGARYLVRNVFFEPVENSSVDWVEKCIREIDVAFKWKKPAIISSHRVNFIGNICRENRERNLRLLNDLLSKIIRRYPDVEFMSSDRILI